MKIVELSPQEFDEFTKFHPLSSYCQTSKYAMIMSEYGYEYDYIGYKDDYDKLQAATLVLTKKIGDIALNTKYGYAPKGFLINYYDKELLSNFMEHLRKFYEAKNFIFIKFNPEIIIGEGTYENKYNINYNGNVKIIDDLKELKIKRRMELQEFDLMQPKLNAYINLKKYDYNNLNINYRKKIKNAQTKGMKLVVGGPKDIDILYSFIKNKTKHNINYFRNFYNTFNKDNAVDLVFLKIDYEEYLTNVKKKYEEEVANNDYYNNLIQKDPKRKNLNRKINSDIKLNALKNNVIKATEALKKNKSMIIGGALIIKHLNRVSIIASGYDEAHKELNPNHYLYHSIFERYKPYFGFCDMRGVSGNYDPSGKYYGINMFKLNFKPTVYEFIGEFDLICSDKIFKKFIKTIYVEDEFDKH